MGVVTEPFDVHKLATPTRTLLPRVKSPTFRPQPIVWTTAFSSLPASSPPRFIAPVSYPASKFSLTPLGFRLSKPTPFPFPNLAPYRTATWARHSPRGSTRSPDGRCPANREVPPFSSDLLLLRLLPLLTSSVRPWVSRPTTCVPNHPGCDQCPPTHR